MTDYPKNLLIFIPRDWVQWAFKKILIITEDMFFVDVRERKGGREASEREKQWLEKHPSVAFQMCPIQRLNTKSWCVS